MAIPKTIYQTFKSNEIPWLTKLYIWVFRRKNPNYDYVFFDDAAVNQFFKDHFDERVNKAYQRLQIGAAKADFFRYAVLFIYGGVYLDLDSDLLVSLDKHLQPDDVAVISPEKNHPEYFAQWGLIFDKGHPFLKRTIDYVVENIEQNKYPHDVHKTTGPSIYTQAIQDVLREDSTVPHRVVAPDYKGIMQFKYRLGKLLLYKDRKNHWKKLQTRITVVKPEH